MIDNIKKFGSEMARHGKKAVAAVAAPVVIGVSQANAALDTTAIDAAGTDIVAFTSVVAGVCVAMYAGWFIVKSLPRR